ncbi:hypothetical protein HK102_005224 [Quaeritorhiza haematococci]|nr:hypothetical protein HK102_005224 [Quaeritorhiza haematococci]
MPTKKKQSTVGRALIRSRFTPNARMNPDGSLRHTTDLDDGAKWTRMQSVTQENDLEAFLNTAQLAGTDFAAERLNIQVVSNAYSNPFLLTPEKEKETLKQHEENKDRLTIPRRPYWDETTTAEELQRAEREEFLDWRRELAQLEDEMGLLLTPYERNLEVWRQLWRVIERSDLVCQIVDARNPLLFRSTDLETYVKETDERKKNLLIVNKADLLSERQRTLWADTFESLGIRFVFFSAALAKEKLEEEEDEEYEDSEDEDEEGVEEAADSEGEEVESVDEENESDIDDHVVPSSSPARHSSSSRQQAASDPSERIRILSADELIDLFQSECPSPIRETDTKVTVGFVGYPNVGKSSTLNALVGAKKVAVASTPGKTKHFQTIHLSDTMILCDCPGLVFPSFATTKADMVTNGILPIDQLREHTGPSDLVAQRIPKHVLEKIYGIRIRTKDREGRLVERRARGDELLKAYAIARGYTRAVQGNPDESRAARYVLKDYVNGKLLFCHPPPGIDPITFNKETYQRMLASTNDDATVPDTTTQQRSQAADSLAQNLSNLSISADNASSTPDEPDTESYPDSAAQSTHIILPDDKPAPAARTVGKFASTNFSRVGLYPHQNKLDATGKLSGPSADTSASKGKGKGKATAEVGGDDVVLKSVMAGAGAAAAGSGKKHFKGKRQKTRTRWTKED